MAVDERLAAPPPAALSPTGGALGSMLRQQTVERKADVLT